MIAPLVVLAPRRRRLPAPDRARARRARARASCCARASRRRCEIEPEEHTSHVVFGDGRRHPERTTTASRRSRCSTPSSTASRSATTSSSCCASAPARRAGAASSTTASCPPRRASIERAVSFTKGCYPGQEPIARLHYRGHANRGCACSSSTATELPDVRRRARLGEKAVGRVTSAAPRRRERSRSATSASRVARGRRRSSGPGAAKRGYTDLPAPVAQGIERCPAEAEVASSNLAGRIRP